MPSAASPRILVLRRRYVGDIVLLESVFRLLRRHWPAAKITACVDPAYRDLPKLHPAIDATLTMPVRLRDWPGFLWKLRREKFTHVLDFDNRPRTALIALFTRWRGAHAEGVVIAGGAA